MVATPLDVDRPEVADAGEAVGVHDGGPAHRRVGDPRSRDLEQDAAQRVVDLLVVLVLPLRREAGQDRSDAEGVEEFEPHVIPLAGEGVAELRYGGFTGAAKDELPLVIKRRGRTTTTMLMNDAVSE